MPRTLPAGEFHDVRGTTRRIAGLVLAEAVYPGGHRLPEHAHEQPFFTLVLAGSFSEHADGVPRRCRPSSLLFYPEDEPHSEAFGPEGGRSLNIELGSGWLQRMEAFRIPRPERSLEIVRRRSNWLATRLFRAWREGGSASELAIEEAVLSMLADLAEVGVTTVPDRTRPRWLGRVVELLHAEFRTGIAMADLAEEAGVHPVHLTRVFKRSHGCTPGEYLRDLRIEYACEQLANSRSSLASVAFLTGFSDQSHFNRRFKQVTGMTPGVYRRLVAIA